ncbi:MAG: NDP-sugar synthase [Acidobacteriota bacterium]
MKGMILAAGLGTRLYPLTAFRAKPAIPFLNRPLLQYSRDLLIEAHLTDIVINSHHLPSSVREALESEARLDGHRVTFSHEDTILGSAGAIGKVREFLKDDTFVVCNGKVYCEQDLEPVIRFHRDHNNLVTLVLVRHSAEDAYASVMVDDQTNITGFRPECPGNSFVFTGIHVLDPQIFDFIPEGPSKTVDDIYPRLIQEGCRVQAFISEAYWCECSTSRNYLSNSLEVLHRKNLDNLIDSETQSSCDGVISAPSVHLAPSCVLKNTILWDDVTVGEGTTLSDVIITAGVTLKAHSHLKNSIVTPQSRKLDHPSIVGRHVEDYCVFPL